jgi:CRISPR/Cas system-associated endonuclease Cas1
MKRDTMKALVRLFEQKLASTVLYPPTGENMSYRQVILQQIRRCARFILGKEDEYVPFTWSR